MGEGAGGEDAVAGNDAPRAGENPPSRLRILGRFLLSCVVLVLAWAGLLVAAAIASCLFGNLLPHKVGEVVLPASFCAVCVLGLGLAYRRRRHPSRAGIPGWCAYGPPVAMAMLSIAGYAWLRWSPEARLLRTDTGSLRATVVQAHPGLPIPEGRNALWCGSFQLAWDALKRDVARGPVRIAPPPVGGVVDLLNATSGSDYLLPEAAWVAGAGLVSRGVLDGIRSDLSRRFGADAPGLPAPPPSPGAIDTIALFGCLQRDLPFEYAFEACEERLAFAGGKPRVRAFGLNPDSPNPRKAEIRGQVRYAQAGPDRSEGFVLEFTFKGGEDRMVVAMLPREGTLEETWQRAMTVFGADEPVTLRNEVLSVPRMNFEIAHDFREFVGAKLAGDHPITLSRQVTRLRLDERGASLRSISISLAAYLYAPRRLIVDRPFLLGLFRKGAARPYLLLWVENDELLDKG